MEPKYCFVCTHPGGRGSDPSFQIKTVRFNRDGTVAEFRDVVHHDAYPGRMIQEVEQMLHDLKNSEKIYIPSDAVGYPLTDEIPF